MYSALLSQSYNSTNANGLASRCPFEVLRPTGVSHAVGEPVDDLLNVLAGNLNPRVADADGWPTEVETNHRQAEVHRLQHRDAPGVVQAREQEHVMGPEEGQYLVVRDGPQEFDLRFDAEVSSERPQSRKFRPHSHHGEAGSRARTRELRDSANSESNT